MLCPSEVIVVAFLEVSFSKWLPLYIVLREESHKKLWEIRTVLAVKLYNKINTWEWSLTWCYFHTSAVLCIPEPNTQDNFYLKILREKVKSQCWNWFLGLAVSPVCIGVLGMSLVLSVNFSLCNREDSIYYGRLFWIAFVKCFED